MNHQRCPANQTVQKAASRWRDVCFNNPKCRMPAYGDHMDNGGSTKDQADTFSSCRPRQLEYSGILCGRDGPTYTLTVSELRKMSGDWLSSTCKAVLGRNGTPFGDCDSPRKQPLRARLGFAEWPSADIGNCLNPWYMVYKRGAKDPRTSS